MTISEFKPVRVRNLLLDPSLHPRGQPHLSAASGLVRAGNWLYVVADDEHHLGVMDGNLSADGEAGDAPAAVLRLLRLFKGDLPRSQGKRKAAKPDLEALAALPPMPGYPAGALLALGSGSRPTRETGVLLALDKSGSAADASLNYVDLRKLYGLLREEFADLNIEGAFFDGDRPRLGAGTPRTPGATFSLLQRGNKGDGRNARIIFRWTSFANWLVGRRATPPRPLAIQLIDIGAIGGVPLGLTDGAALQGGGWVFSAVAENTGDSFNDGVCAGSVVGLVSNDGVLRQLHRLKGKPKVEGVAVREQGNEIEVTLVIDADDPKQPSRMLRVRLKRNPDQA